MARVATVNFPQQVDGDTFITKEFRYWTELDVTGLDLLDVTPKIQIRKETENGRLYKTATIGDGLEWVDQANGQFQFGGFDINWGGAGEYYYDVQFTYATSGVTRTYVKGTITVIDDTTV